MKRTTQTLPAKKAILTSPASARCVHGVLSRYRELPEEYVQLSRGWWSSMVRRARLGSTSSRRSPASSGARWLRLAQAAAHRRGLEGTLARDGRRGAGGRSERVVVRIRARVA